MRKLLISLFVMSFLLAVPSFGAVHAGRRAAKASLAAAKVSGKAAVKGAKAAFNFLF